MTCPRGDGVNVIRAALSHLRDENSTEDVTVDIRLLGSPRYSVKIIAPDYKWRNRRLRPSCAVPSPTSRTNAVPPSSNEASNL